MKRKKKKPVSQIAPSRMKSIQTMGSFMAGVPVAPVNQERIERLKALSPIQAAQAWLDGEFGFGEEFFLIKVMRRDPRITMSDDDICELMFEALDGEWSAETCLERLSGSV